MQRFEGYWVEYRFWFELVSLHLLWVPSSLIQCIVAVLSIFCLTLKGPFRCLALLLLWSFSNAFLRLFSYLWTLLWYFTLKNSDLPSFIVFSLILSLRCQLNRQSVGVLFADFRFVFQYLNVLQPKLMQASISSSLI